VTARASRSFSGSGEYLKRRAQTFTQGWFVRKKSFFFSHLERPRRERLFTNESRFPSFLRGVHGTPFAVMGKMKKALEAALGSVSEKFFRWKRSRRPVVPRIRAHGRM
jgi:hypothetical protein